MKLRVKTNIVGGIGAMIFSIVLFVLSFQIREAMPTSASVGSAFFPRAMAILIFVLGGGMLIQSLITGKSEVIELNVTDELRTLAFLGIIVVYILVLKYLGFLASTLGMTVAVLWFLSCRSWRIYLICGLAATAIWAGFRFGLGISLPQFALL